MNRAPTTEAIMDGILQEEREDDRREGFQQGRQEALREGLLKAIQFGLELKFGMAGLALLPDIQKIQDLDLLNTIQEALKIANSPQEIRLLWEQPTSH
jgi:predicted transposase YdaD